MIKKLLNENIHFISNYDYIVSGDYKKSSVKECLEWAWEQESLAVDSETLGKNPHTKPIVALQIGTPERQYVIDVRGVPITLFKALLETKLLLLHNAKFDYKFLKHNGIIIENIYDTMLAECVIYAGCDSWGYGLDRLCERYLGVTLDKSDRGGFYKLSSEPFNTYQITYAARDVAYLHLIREQQLLLINKYNLNYCLDIENKVVKSLADIEYNGIILNEKKWLSNTNKTEAVARDIINSLDAELLKDDKFSMFVPKYVQTDLFGAERRRIEVNYDSPVQVLKILKTIGIEEDDTSDRTLEKNKSLHPFIALLQEYRAKAKILSTYGKSFLNYVNKDTRKIHTSFWQVLKTGRISSGSKDDNSPNMQNIPAENEFRNCFEAREGFLWVSCDYSSQELMLMAEGSNEQGFIDVLNKGDDLHCYVGSMMFGRTITKADKEDRTKAKTINFAKPYGASTNKIADLLSISKEEAEELFTLYAKAFPNLDKWLKKNAELAKTNKYSITFSPSLRRRWYPKMREAETLRRERSFDWKEIFKIEGETERNGMNHPIQGTGADICKEALIAVRDLVLRYNKEYNEEVAFLLCTVHDAIDVEVREDLAQAFAAEMEKSMVECGNKYVSKVKMKVDTTITKEWTK